jgi:RNA polymerase sigma-70 factor (ECF subfamily)
LNDGFLTTRWSLVVHAGASDSDGSRRALSQLCGDYWYPLYAYARRRGKTTGEAEDLVQGFFAELLEKDWIRDADQGRGRFRAFLLTAFKRHAGHVRDKEQALKRGGGRAVVPLDVEEGERRYSLEPIHDETPERIYERRWALTLLGHVVESLRAEMSAAGKGALFDALLPHVTGGSGRAPYAELAERLDMTEGALKTAASRLRARYRDRLRAEIADTVADPEDVDGEITHLVSALRGRA